MRLFYDARYIRTDFHDGISRFSTELGAELSKLTDTTFLICDENQKKFLPKKAKTLLIHKPASVKEPFTASVLNKYKPDVVYSPLQTIGGMGRNFKLVITSHDLIYYRHRKPPTQMPALIRAGWRLYHLTYVPQRAELNAADLVVTVSHTSKREFEQAKLTKRPIVVVPNAPQRFSATPHHSGKVKNIVYMGSFMPYKNVETLIKGMRWLPGRTLHLLSRISEKRAAEFKALIPAKANVIFHNGVTDETYERLLADNAVLATASFDEGYGLPIAEALAMGVPAVVSNIPIFHEVAAGGALYFDPKKPKAFAEAVMQLDKKTTRDDVIQAGTAHARSFSWKNSARALYNAILSL